MSNKKLYKAMTPYRAKVNKQLGGFFPMPLKESKAPADFDTYRSVKGVF